MNPTYTKITPEIYSKCDEAKYIVYIDGEVVVFMDNIDEAKEAVDSFGQFELDLLKAKTDESSTQINLEHSNDGTTFKIKTKALGYLMNGTEEVYMTIHYEKVCRAVTKGRVPPPVPPKPQKFSIDVGPFENIVEPMNGPVYGDEDEIFFEDFDNMIQRATYSYIPPPPKKRQFKFDFAKPKFNFAKPKPFDFSLPHSRSKFQFDFKPVKLYDVNGNSMDPPLPSPPSIPAVGGWNPEFPSPPNTPDFEHVNKNMTPNDIKWNWSQMYNKKL